MSENKDHCEADVIGALVDAVKKLERIDARLQALEGESEPEPSDLPVDAAETSDATKFIDSLLRVKYSRGEQLIDFVRALMIDVLPLADATFHEFQNADIQWLRDCHNHLGHAAHMGYSAAQSASRHPHERDRFHNLTCALDYCRAKSKCLSTEAELAFGVALAMDRAHALASPPIGRRYIEDTIAEVKA